MASDPEFVALMRTALQAAQAQMREYVDFHHRWHQGCSVDFEAATELVETALGIDLTPENPEGKE